MRFCTETDYNNYNEIGICIIICLLSMSYHYSYNVCMSGIIEIYILEI